MPPNRQVSPPLMVGTKQCIPKVHDNTISYDIVFESKGSTTNAIRKRWQTPSSGVAFQSAHGEHVLVAVAQTPLGAPFALQQIPDLGSLRPSYSNLPACPGQLDS